MLIEQLRGRLGRSAKDFDQHLRRLAWERIAANVPYSRAALIDRLANLTYGGEVVPRALLLFNVAGLLEATGSSQLFQFDGFKKNRWDLEHVRSVEEYVPRSPADRKRWLGHAKNFVQSPVGRELADDGGDLLLQWMQNQLEASSPSDEAFAKIFAAVRSLSGEAEVRESGDNGESGDNDLSNLVLLDMGTNRSYRNAIFPVKRQRIIDLDAKGQFVPPGTRNVFLKYYAPDATQLLLWGADDQVAYGQRIEQTLGAFFADLSEEHG